MPVPARSAAAPAQPAQATPTSYRRPTVTAPSEDAARQWLKLVDANEAEASRREAGTAMRRTYSESLWNLGVALRRNNFGIVTARRLVDVRQEGGYEVLTFETDFSKEKGVIEEVFMQRENGVWKAMEFKGEREEDC